MISAMFQTRSSSAHLATQEITPEKVEKWHREGFNVRAWGVYNEELMRHAYDCMTDGMTVNFPDKLTEYIKEKDA